MISDDYERRAAELTERSDTEFAKFQRFLNDGPKLLGMLEDEALSGAECDALPTKDVVGYAKDRIRCYEQLTLSLEELIHNLREVTTQRAILKDKRGI